MIINKILISGLFIGYIKYAPGTIASLLALLVFYLSNYSIIFQIYLLFALLIVGFYLCYDFSKSSLIKDPPFIVVDEIVGMYISVFMLPKSFFLYFVAFVLFRFFDIYKPGIINKSQNLNFGIGIMLDDIISGVFTALICWGLYLW